MKSNLMFTGGRPFDHHDEPHASQRCRRDARFGRARPGSRRSLQRAKGRTMFSSSSRPFYLDPERPIGVNNLALDNAAMPHVLADLQGTQKAVFVPGKEGRGQCGADGACSITSNRPHPAV